MHKNDPEEQSLCVTLDPHVSAAHLVVDANLSPAPAPAVAPPVVPASSLLACLKELIWPYVR